MKTLEVCQTLSAASFMRRDQMRVGMAERVHRDAGVEIEISGPVLADQAHALAPLESEWRSGVGAVQRGHDVPLWSDVDGGVAKAPQKPKTRCHSARVGAAEICLRGPVKVNFAAASALI